MQKIPLIAVVGPTASGKTEVGLVLAQALNGEVLCVDSRTVYRGMDIGTAKAEPRQVIHWGIDLVDPDEPFTVADFKDYAEKKIAEIAARGKTPILVGGTGLYFRALLDGLTLTDVKPNPALRAELEEKSTEELAELLGEKDPDAAAQIDAGNRRRLVRALEIVMTTGKSLAAQQKKNAVPYDACIIGMNIERDELHRRIDARVDAMIADGLVDEARILFTKYGADSQAMSGIGYRQLAAFFEEKMQLRDAVERIKFDTRHYAKRQMTWFKADARVQWITNVTDAITVARAFLENEK